MEIREIANKIYNELLPKYNITAYLISKDWYVSFIENVLNSNKLNQQNKQLLYDNNDFLKENDIDKETVIYAESGNAWQLDRLIHEQNKQLLEEIERLKSKINNQNKLL